MNDNKNQNNDTLTKKVKADAAGKNIAEVAARGAGRYLGGTLGGAAVDAALKTKTGQNIVGQASKMVNKNPITRNALTNNSQNIRRGKPFASSLVGGSMIGDADTSNTSEFNNSYDDSTSDSTSDIKGSIKVSGLFNGSLKNKFVLLGIVISIALFFVIFLVVFITPLMSLGIIDISGVGSSGGSSYPGYSYVSNNTKYWWPVASTQDNITFDSSVPVSTHVTSDYGDQESFRASGHGGIDIGNGGNGPGVVNIIASRDGTVIYPNTSYQTLFGDNGYIGSTDGEGYGNFVMIQHNDGTITLYAHMAKNSITVFAGDTVKQGQVIGKMGNSGSSLGTHLHFEVRVNGSRVYPLNYINAKNTRPKVSGVINVSGNSVKQSVCLTLKSSGFTDNSVAALLTNINAESSFDIDADGDLENGEYMSYGLCQWHAGRKNNLITSFPDSYNTVGSQLEFLMYELENDYPSLYNELLNGNDSASDITYNFCYDFERPRDTATTCKNRTNSTSEFLQYVKNGCQ